MTYNLNPNQNITECLTSIYDGSGNMLNEQFNTPSPNKMPQLMICPDIKNLDMSINIYKNLMDSETLNINSSGCTEIFNVRNLNDAGLLQLGYARNINLDSELRGINYYTDKCYYDNRKINPNKPQ